MLHWDKNAIKYERWCYETKEQKYVWRENLIKISNTFTRLHVPAVYFWIPNKISCIFQPVNLYETLKYANYTVINKCYKPVFISLRSGYPRVTAHYNWKEPTWCSGM